MGKSNTNCCVVNCPNTYKNTEGQNVKFYRFPAREYDTARKQAWIKAINRKNLDGSDWTPTKSSFICSKHFENGTALNNTQSPSYVPTIFPEIYKKKKPEAVQNQKRYERHLKRQRNSATHCDGKQKIAKKDKKCASSESSLSENDNAIASSSATTVDTSTTSSEELPISQPVNNDSDREIPRKQGVDFGTQTDVSVPCEGYSIKLVKNDNLNNSKNSVKNNDLSVVHHCNGFHGYSSIKTETDLHDIAGTSKSVFDMFLDILPANIKTKKISQADRLLIFLIKMKHNFSYNALAVFFGIDRRTTSKIFKIILFQLHDATASPGDFIPWLNKGIILELMPDAFKEKHRNCRIIIDCSEFRVEMPSEVDNRVFIFSHYKNTFTGKFLLGIAPHGVITFLSSVYGGRSSDCAITVDSELLDLLEPNDEVLADKGFPSIVSALAERHVVTLLPPRNHADGLSVEEIDQGYDVSHLRIHVERAIGRVKTYNILQLISHDLFPNVDQIVHMCCVLANLQPPIIKH